MSRPTDAEIDPCKEFYSDEELAQLRKQVRARYLAKHGVDTMSIADLPPDKVIRDLFKKLSGVKLR